MPAVLVSIRWLNLAAFATTQKQSDIIIDKPIKQTSLKKVSANGAKCLISLKAIACGIRSSTKDKNVLFLDAALQEVLYLKS